MPKKSIKPYAEAAYVSVPPNDYCVPRTQPRAYGRVR
jgi:hypothetical protein